MLLKSNTFKWWFEGLLTYWLCIVPAAYGIKSKGFFFKAIQIANNRNELILVWVQKGRCHLRIQSVSWNSREGAEPPKELKSDLGTLSRTEASICTWISECVCFLFSLLRPTFSAPPCIRQKMSAPQSTSFYVSHVQPCPESGYTLNSNSTFPEKFHIIIAFLLPSKHYQMPEYINIFWRYATYKKWRPPRHLFLKNRSFSVLIQYIDSSTPRFHLSSYSQGSRVTWHKYDCEALTSWMRKPFFRKEGLSNTPKCINFSPSQHDFNSRFPCLVVFMHSQWSSQTLPLIKCCISVFSPGFSVLSSNMEKIVLILRIWQMIFCRIDSWGRFRRH